MKAYSLKRQLTLAVITGSVLILLVASVFLDTMLNYQMQQFFNASLLEQARALETLVENTAANGVVFNFTEEILPEFEDQKNSQYFQLWNNRGMTLERSPSLRKSNLPQFKTALQNYSFHDVQLPDGRPGRLVEITFTPRRESTATMQRRTDRGEPNKRHLGVTLSLARERLTLQRERATTRMIIGGATLSILLAIAILVKKFVHSGLLPLERLAGQMSKIDKDSLDRRISHHGPQCIELATIEQQTNFLLERLQAAFEREKRFSADVSHELRTPLAELKSLAEVGQQSPSDLATVRSFFRDVEEISAQMEKLVTTLIDLARADSGQLQTAPEKFELAPEVDAVLRVTQVTPTQEDRIVNKVPTGLLVFTDREKLKLILINLLANAAQYSPPDSRVLIECFTEGNSIELTVTNTTLDLDPADIAKMRQRFWRKDPARHNANSGLGLSLVDTLASALGLVLDLELSDKNKFRVQLSGILAA